MAPRGERVMWRYVDRTRNRFRFCITFKASRCALDRGAACSRVASTTVSCISFPSARSVEALAERDVAIVVSSSWRFGYEYRELLAFLPAALSRRVVGMTGEPQFGEHGRYQEILHWLRRQGSVCDWRALDDAAFEFPEGCPELILCNPNVGIDPFVVERLGRWLDALGRN